MLQHKIELYNSCLAHIEDQIARANSAMANAQQDSNQQTKSSAGDKYETGRAMAQLDKERYAQALSTGHGREQSPSRFVVMEFDELVFKDSRWIGTLFVWDVDIEIERSASRTYVRQRCYLGIVIRESLSSIQCNAK